MYFFCRRRGQGQAEQGREEGPQDHVQAGAQAGGRGHQGHHQEVKEHPLRHQQAGCLQEPRIRHIHRFRRGKDRGSKPASPDGGDGPVL
mgnify:CR=1 FL=1